ncbi:MAG: DAK2 domain-containing protein [Firmicutes bacterium]|nr:DAK2 domain-containing protein [Bacillota bacterium]
MHLEYIDGAKLKQMIQAASSWLSVNKESVDALNVFPVPDGDTGTNMSLTLQSAAREAEKVDSQSASVVAEAMAQGSLMGARGNSGVILSQLFRGFAQAISGKDKLNAKDFAAGLKGAYQQAYRAVMKPVEGTVLTVAREAATAAMEEAKKNSDIIAVAQVFLLEGNKSLARTPELLSVLKEAQVVDAGGKGLLVAWEGAIKALKGGQVDWESVAEDQSKKHERAGAEGGSLSKETTEGALRYKYCTEFLVRGKNLNLDQIRTKLEPRGDSLLVVGDPNLAKIHIHTNNPGWVLEYCGALGDLLEIDINNMAEQNREFNEKKASEAREEEEVSTLYEDEGSEFPLMEDRQVSVVAVVAGTGLERIFRSLGVDSIIHGGQTMNPSTQDLLQAVEECQSDEVVVLPNNGNVVLTAQQVPQITKKKVSVIPTKSVPQGIAALLAFDPTKSLEENEKSMRASFGTVKTGEVTYAIRNSRFNGVEIEEKDVIGLADGEIRCVGKNIGEVTQELIEDMLDEDSELISLYYGSEVSSEDAEALYETLVEEFPDYEIELHYGGQPLYFYFISVE